MESVTLAVNLATCVWNDGYTHTVTELHNLLSIGMSLTLQRLAESKDWKRLEQAERRDEAKNQEHSVKERDVEDVARIHNIPQQLKVTTTSVLKAKRKKTDDYSSGGHDGIEFDG